MTNTFPYCLCIVCFCESEWEILHHAVCVAAALQRSRSNVYWALGDIGLHIPLQSMAIGDRLVSLSLSGSMVLDRYGGDGKEGRKDWPNHQQWDRCLDLQHRARDTLYWEYTQGALLSDGSLPTALHKLKGLEKSPVYLRPEAWDGRFVYQGSKAWKGHMFIMDQKGLKGHWPTKQTNICKVTVLLMISCIRSGWVKGSLASNQSDYGWWHHVMFTF